MKKKLMLIAGEPSGDLQGSLLVSALKSLEPDLEISGMGGIEMQEAGVRILHNISQVGIIGFTDVAKKFLSLRHIFYDLLKELKGGKYSALVLIDYPGFNLNLATAAKRFNIPVIYYISPQIWAWWRNRIYKIKKNVDKMIVVFDFEKEIYEKAQVDVTFVGHPLIDIARATLSREDFLKTIDVDNKKVIIGLLPGSRTVEVKRLLPLFLKTAEIIQQEIESIHFLLLKSPSVDKSEYKRWINKTKLATTLVESINQQNYNLLNSCDAVIVASGSATLETAIMQKPMAIVYKVSFLNWLIARFLIKTKNIGLVNVVAQRRVVPEFIQFGAKPKLIADSLLQMLKNLDHKETIVKDLAQVRSKLGSPGAAYRAAGEVLEQLT